MLFMGSSRLDDADDMPEEVEYMPEKVDLVRALADLAPEEPAATATMLELVGRLRIGSESAGAGPAEPMTSASLLRNSCSLLWPPA